MVTYASSDRKILRFLRGHAHDIDKVCEHMRKFLEWRDSNGVDTIRESILRGGLNHPKLFPNGDKVSQSLMLKTQESKVEVENI